MKFFKTEFLAGAEPRKRRGGFPALVLVLVLLSGCAKSAYEVPPAEPPRDAREEKSSVERLDDGRQGFIIREIPKMDAASLADFERGVAMLDEGNYEKGVELFEKVVTGSPGVTAPHINLAMAYTGTGRPEPAEQHLKRALALFPGHPAAGNQYGLLLRKSGRFTEARAIYEKTLDSFPEYLPVRRNLGILCDLYLDDQECALRQFEIYREARPDDDQIETWIAELRLRLGR